MKKTIIGIMLIAMIFLLASCGVNEPSTKDRLLSPTNSRPPIAGKWILNEHINSLDGDLSQEDKSWVGTEGLFHKEAVILGKDFTTKPSYKTRKVNSLDYLLYKYKLSPLDLGIEEEEIQIVTLLNDKQYFNEFIKYEDYFIVNIDNNFYKMEELGKEVSLEETLRYIEIEKAMIRDVDTTDPEKMETGLLLGIKIPSYDEENDLPIWDYKTLWIKSKNKSISPAYDLENLLLPRKNGFWTITSSREVNKGTVMDTINTDSHNKEGLLKNRLENLRSNPENPSLKNILFLSSNYISLEKTELENDNRKTLGLYSLDNLKDEKPMKLSDIIGEEGREIFTEGVQSVVSMDEGILVNESNIRMTRKNGYWILKGRVNYKQNENETYKDFNIREIPPKEIVNYDEHPIPWEAIKREIPEAVDMYSSPNKEFILVVTNYDLRVYTIDNGERINPSAELRINLPRNASVIMSEWSTGRYVDIWEKQVLAEDGQLMER